VRIDAATGRVTAVVVAAGLLTPDEAESADVLNGIAYDPKRRLFLLTGKHWPHVFEVRLVPRPAAKAR
jgi:glutaminyl-peptide cyclotransferase